ncbi:PaREP1 family protein [Acidianus ambivalens]|uniref:PaREP1 family protein n=1 Tax=Acidianus ambivalens TaxID=2283 RepID=UPI001E5627C9|nr:PaREP1 family protein [Acidianus ambivalens]
MDELPKSWINKEAYKKVRLEEAKYEAELAKKFLEQGLTRNAAGKIFQAVKALVAAKAVDNKEYKGKVKLRNGKKVEKAEWNSNSYAYYLFEESCTVTR